MVHPAATGRANAPIDVEHLSLYTGNDPIITRDVLMLFREQASAWLKSLRAAETVEAWRQAAHKMKGGARGVGANDLAALAEAAESVSSLGSAEQVQQLSEIAGEVARATAYAGQLLDDSQFS